MQSHAGAAKSAIDAMTKHWAVEFGPHGVRVNGIAPGPIGETVGMQKLSRGKENWDSIPLGVSTVVDSLDGNSVINFCLSWQRIGAIKDIEHSTVFLFSEGANWITGVTLVVDGGHWMNNSQKQYPEIILNPPKHRL
jgi:peroxisomal 2,4-dienoyl-CoA reductase